MTTGGDYWVTGDSGATGAGQALRDGSGITQQDLNGAGAGVAREGWGEQAAREARLSAGAFRGLLLKRQRPSIDRADELCRALGITMTIGGKAKP